MEIIAYFASLNPLKLLRNLPGGIAQGILWGIMALGVYITFKVLNVSDLTVEGSFATGGAVAVMLIILCFGFAIIINQIFKLISRFDFSVFTRIQIQFNDMGLFDSIFPKFLCDRTHQTGFSTTPDTRNDLDKITIMVKSPNALKIILSLIYVHDPYSTRESAGMSS